MNKVSRKKGFTLIELIAVLVIMAIIALIVTPLVMNIIRKARVSADKRSIDAYGRSIELAIAGYLLDTGKFPTDVSQLTIEHSGNEVICSTTHLNSDSSVYLSGCTVAGRPVDYTYGTLEEITYDYRFGEEIEYNGVQYRVLKDVKSTDKTVLLLKSTPLTVSEVNSFGGVGTENNHVNMHATTDTTSSYYQKADNYNGSNYGGVQYYSSDSCYVDSNNEYVSTNCLTNYSQSEIKFIVDNWANSASNATDLSTDSSGYSARLLSLNDITSMGLEFEAINANQMRLTGEAPEWLFMNEVYYWTMSPAENTSVLKVWGISSAGHAALKEVQSKSFGVVRPVINIKKSAID